MIYSANTSACVNDASMSALLEQKLSKRQSADCIDICESTVVSGQL